MRADEAELRRLSRVKRTSRAPEPMLGPDMVEFFKRSIQKRQTKFTKIGECWGTLVPETFCEHTSLESFTKGTLTVLVDSASHLYELKQLLLAGLERQLLIACKSTGLRKISLKRGRWYEGEGAERKIRF
jgi:Dna[CI] antecedent DciA-like protein